VYFQPVFNVLLAAVLSNNFVTYFLINEDVLLAWFVLLIFFFSVLENTGKQVFLIPYSKRGYWG